MIQPNIVLIMTDTQPTEVVGCYSGQDVQTHEIDRLAAQGVRFDRAYCSSPLCTPARAGMFTGMIPSRAGAYTNSQPLGDNIINMGQRLQAAGYRSAFIGKWHLDGHDYFGSGQCPKGWEGSYWYDGKNYLVDLSTEEAALWRRGLIGAKNLRKHEITSEFTWAHRISDRADRFLAEQTVDRPFLLVTSFDEPHHPWTCPPEFVERFMDVKIPIGPSAFDNLENKPQHQKDWAAGWIGVQEPTGELYQPLMLGCNAYVDTQMGRVARAAQAWSRTNDRPTWIIVTSDHGDHLGAHRLRSKGPTGYDQNTRIPLIIVPPGDFADGNGTGTVQPSVVSHLDLLPTFLELAGERLPETLDGTSLLNLIGNEELDSERIAFTEYTRYELGHDGFGGLEPLRMLVKWPWKLVINLHRTDELYNLAEDPHEMNNRIEDPSVADTRDSIHQELINWMDDHVDPQRGGPWECRAWRDARKPAWTQDAPMRPVRDDGMSPPYFDYDSGKVTKGTKAQFS